MEELARTWKLVRQMLGRWKWEQSYWRKTVFSAPVKMVVNVNCTRLGWYRENIRLHKCLFLLIMSIYKAVLRGEGVLGTYLAAGKCHNSDPFPIFANYLGGFVYESFWVSFFLALGSTTTFRGSRGRPWTPTALLPDCSAAWPVADNHHCFATSKYHPGTILSSYGYCRWVNHINVMWDPITNSMYRWLDGYCLKCVQCTLELLKLIALVQFLEGKSSESFLATLATQRRGERLPVGWVGVGMSTWINLSCPVLPCKAPAARPPASSLPDQPIFSSKPHPSTDNVCCPQLRAKYEQ